MIDIEQRKLWETKSFAGDAKSQCELGDVYFFNGDDEEDKTWSAYWYERVRSPRVRTGAI